MHSHSELVARGHAVGYIHCQLHAAVRRDGHLSGVVDHAFARGGAIARVADLVPVRNDIAGIFGRMQPRCQRYRGSLLVEDTVRRAADAVDGPRHPKQTAPFRLARAEEAAGGKG